MSLTRVCTSFCHFIWTAFKFKTELLNYPKPKGQPQHGIFSSSDAGAAYGPNDLTPLFPGMNDGPRRVQKEDDHSENEGSAEDLAKLVAPDASSEKEVARLEHERIADLERLLSETLAAQTERDRHAAQLTVELSQKTALLEQAEANAAEAKERAGAEVRGLRAELDESLLSRNHALEQVANAAEEKERARVELRGLRAELDESLLSRDHALQQAEANAAEERERTGRELRELQANLDELLLSCDHALERAHSALQKASCAAEANEQGQRELTEMRAELEAKMSKSALSLRLRLADMENGYVKSIAEADTYRIQTATGLVNTDELIERVQALEAEMASLQRGGTREAWLG